MNLLSIERHCLIYRKMGLKVREERLLKVALKKHPDCEWAIKRINELYPVNEVTTVNIKTIEAEEIIEDTKEPHLNSALEITKKNILRKSYKYQKEWLFEAEKKLIQEALQLFPEWEYLNERLEWHARPLFHRDPQKSKLQPRKSLQLNRDVNFIPKKETLSSLCFVTAAGSDQPYFDLSIQLLESIKATRFYNHIPIKILDCGLTEEDSLYLKTRFNCEIKDPGWDIPENTNISYINGKILHSRPLGFKALTARPYVHKHFPGYQYYFWIDTDSWIQNENILDLFIQRCEKQGLAVTNEINDIWRKTQTTNKKAHIHTIPYHYLNIMVNKTLLCNGFYCISKKYSELYAKYCDQALAEKKQYSWGFDMAMLNHLFYKEIDGAIFTENFYYYTRMPHLGAHINEEKNILTTSNELIGCVNLTWYLKKLPCRVLFSNALITNEEYWVSKEIVATTQLTKFSTEVAEEKAHTYCAQNEWQQGSLSYRTYPDPENKYGEIK